MNTPLQFAAEGLEVIDLPLGEHEALALGSTTDRIAELRRAAIYGYLMAQQDINTVTSESNG